MNGGIINEDYLSQNIKFIEYYANEEKEILSKICLELEMCSKYYNSTNQIIISKQIDEIKTDVEKLYQKRKKYNEIFSQVIVRYNAMSNEVKRSIYE